MKMKYDVIVVGGRIGGSISSMFASKNGAKVLMLEKRQEIGSPVQCAGATSCETFEILSMKPSPEFISTEIYGGTICSPDGNRAKLKSNKLEGFILERKNFDKHLAIETARAGTDIMVKTTVTDLIRKNGKIVGVKAKHLGKTLEFNAEVVIAADGIESQLSHLAGIKSNFTPQDIGSCAQYEMVGLEVDPHYLEFYFGKDLAPGGYIWKFPKGDDRANVGVGVRGTTQTAYHYLKNFVEKNGGTPVEFNMGGVPLSGYIDKTFNDGFLVVGDAAGQVDPLSGGGIHTTAYCARIAGEVAAKAIEKEDTSQNFLKTYEIQWKKHVGKNIDKSLKYRRIMDKLTDKEYNGISEFLQGHDMQSISKLSMLGLVKGQPNLLRLLRDLI